MGHRPTALKYSLIICIYSTGSPPVISNKRKSTTNEIFHFLKTLLDTLSAVLSSNPANQKYFREDIRFSTLSETLKSCRFIEGVHAVALCDSLLSILFPLRLRKTRYLVGITSSQRTAHVFTKPPRPHSPRPISSTPIIVFLTSRKIWQSTEVGHPLARNTLKKVQVYYLLSPQFSTTLQFPNPHKFHKSMKSQKPRMVLLLKLHAPGLR